MSGFLKDDFRQIIFINMFYWVTLCGLKTVKMHELSIVMGIVDIAEKEVEKARASKVDVIELDIGELSGVEMEALEFAWKVAVEGTVLNHAERKINRIKAKAKCMDCGSDFEIGALYDPCPECGSFFKDVYQGKELRVKSLEVE
jgi:hydrogenase nickel incorporation protein HypA/HybF